MEPDVGHKVGSCTQQTNKAKRIMPSCLGRTRMWGASELALMGRIGIGAHGAQWNRRAWGATELARVGREERPPQAPNGPAQDPKPKMGPRRILS